MGDYHVIDLYQVTYLILVILNPAPITCPHPLTNHTVWMLVPVAFVLFAHFERLRHLVMRNSLLATRIKLVDIFVNINTVKPNKSIRSPRDEDVKMISQPWCIISQRNFFPPRYDLVVDPKLHR